MLCEALTTAVLFTAVMVLLFAGRGDAVENRLGSVEATMGPILDLLCFSDLGH